MKIARHLGPYFALLLITVALLSAVSLTAADAPKNPFAVKGPVAAPAAAPPSPLDRMEFRGILTVAGQTLITLVDTSNNKPYVIPIDDTVEGLSVSDYRIQDDSVVLNASGQTKRLQLRESKIVTAAVAPARPSPQPNVPGSVPQQRPGTAVAQPAGQIQQISDEEVRQRMERVAEEIRRRRAMRRQMMEQAQPRTQ